MLSNDVYLAIRLGTFPDLGLVMEGYITSYGDDRQTVAVIAKKIAKNLKGSDSKRQIPAGLYAYILMASSSRSDNLSLVLAELRNT